MTRLMSRIALFVVSCFACGLASAEGWYARLDTGWSFARDADFRDDVAVSPDCFIAVNYPGVCGAALDDLESSPIIGVGFGYRFPSGVRVDLTYGHRGGFNLNGYDPEGTYFDADVTSDSGMANIYYDLPVQWNGRVRPFVGAGIGRSRNSVDPIKWYDPSSSGTLTDGETTGTAWHVTLAADIQLEEGWVIEVGYRYADFGKIKKDAGPDRAGQFNPSGNTGSATGELRAHELLLSVRREFGGK